MTPLSAFSVLFGKLLSVAWPLVLLLCSTLPGYVVLMTIKPALVPQVERVAVCLILTAVFLVMVSAAASTLFRSTAASMTAAYVAILAVCAAPLLFKLGEGAPFGRETVAAVLVVDPVAAALQAADMRLEDAPQQPQPGDGHTAPAAPRTQSAWGFADYDLLPANWWIIGTACVVMLVFLGARTWVLFRVDEG
jgi:hypothetical protein